MDGHAQQRIAERAIPNGVTWDDVHRVGGLAEKVKTSAAFLVKSLPSIVGDAEGEFRSRQGSNGNLVFAIAREHEIKTWLLRRSDQDNTNEGLRVDEFVNLLWEE